jgi:hypothetical protein
LLIEPRILLFNWREDPEDAAVDFSKLFIT